MFGKVIRSFHGDPDLAHDAAAETWLAAAKKGEEYFETEGALIGYCLFRVYKMAIDLKSKRRAISGCWDLLENIAVDDENDHISEQVWHELAKSLAQLPELERQIIDLYYYESLSDREIAERLMRQPRDGDSQRKAVYRTRRSAVKRMESFLLESDLDLDYEAALAAIDSRN